MATRVRAPQLPVPDLGELLPGAPEQLANRADLDGLSFDAPAGDVLRLTDATVQSCVLTGSRHESVEAQGLALRDVRWEHSEVVSLRTWRSRWRDVVWDGGRIGVLEAYTSTWNCVAVSNAKISYVNLRGAEVTDLTFRDSQLGEVDLTEARGHRVAFPGCRIDRLVLHSAGIVDLDLRGADIVELAWTDTLSGVVISHDQLIALAPELARQVGARVEG